VNRGWAVAGGIRGVQQRIHARPRRDYPHVSGPELFHRPLDAIWPSARFVYRTPNAYLPARLEMPTPAWRAAATDMCVKAWASARQLRRQERSILIGNYTSALTSEIWDDKTGLREPCFYRGAPFVPRPTPCETRLLAFFWAAAGRPPFQALFPR
jgi:hypothetical protein